MNLIETIKQESRLSKLAAALEKSGLAETLSQQGPFTVFAPNDEAFEDALSVLDDVLADAEVLRDVLNYHIVSKKVTAQDMKDMETSDLETIQGEGLFIHVDEEGILVDEAEVIDSDVMADNGVLHIIDTVLVPVSAELDDDAWEFAAEDAETEDVTEEPVTE